MRNGLCTILSTLIFLSVTAQQPDQALNKWANELPIEKVYLHYDRSGYFAGETMWFKSYLYADFVPSGNSTTLFVELLNSSSKIITRQVYPIFGGFTRGQIDLPDSLSTGKYQVRAYTTAMLNHDLDYLYHKSISIIGKGVKSDKQAVQNIKPRVEFFAEGGNFVTGLSNTIAFKVSDQNGLPLFATGKIFSDNGQVISNFSTVHDGMGYVDLTPVEGSRYYASLDADPEMQKYFLPEQSKNGIVLRVLHLPNGKQFEILQRSDNPDFVAAYMIGQSQHHVAFKTDFKSFKPELSGMINTKDLSSGILQITVFNKDGMPLAERLTFVDNREYLVKADLLNDTVSFANRTLNRLTLAMKDTIVGSFSVAVYDPTFEENSLREDNIISNFLLTSDLKGYVHKPAYYFSSDADSVQNALDLVMMINGWRRFQWMQVRNNSLAQRKYSEPGYISLSGKVVLEGTKKPFADKDLIAFIVTADSSRQTQMVHTDKDGNFSIDSLVFFKRARILFSDIKGRKSKFIDVKLNGDSLNRQFVLPPLKWDLEKNPVNFTDARKLADEYNAIAKAEGTMLGGVVVTGKRKTKAEEFEEKYVRGMFETDALRTMEFLTEDINSYANIFDYLRGRVPGLTIVEPNYIDGDDVAGYQLFLRQSASISSMGALPMTIYLDEVETDPNVIATIPASQIALVKLFTTFVGAPGGGAGGALAIYTKRGDDLLAAVPSSGDVKVYAGYNVMRQFYSPDYSVKKSAPEPDNRITLFWDPAIIIADVNPQHAIRFFNNDRTRNFKVVIEGMTAEGKMLMIEKLISGKAF